MSTRQYAFVIAVLLVWMASDTGWIVLAAIAAGLIALGVSKSSRATSTLVSSATAPVVDQLP